MKKKLLLVAIMAIVFCSLLIISASATPVPTFGEVERIDIDKTSDGIQEIDIYSHLQTVVTEGTNTSASARVLLNCTCEAGQHTYPTYYITKKDGGNYIWFSFTDIDQYNPCGATYTTASILAIEIPNGITTMTNAFKGNTTIKLLDMSTAETMTVILTGSGYNAVSNCTSLVEVRIPASMEEIRGYSFFGCTALERFIIPENSNLTYIGAYSFSGCTSLTAFYLPSKLETIGNNSSTGQGTFNSCTNIYFVNEPVTSTYVPAKPSVYYFPSTLKTICGEEFKSCKSLNDTLVFPSDFTAISNRWAFNGAPFVNAVFLGDMTEVGAQYWGCTSIYLANEADIAISNVATFTKPSGVNVYCCHATDNTTHLYSPRNSETTPATCYSNETGIRRCFCDTEISKGEVEGTMLTTHNYVEDYDCTTCNYCENYGEGKCNQYLDAIATAHDEKHDVVFENGFMEMGVHNTYCSNDSCKMLDAIEELEAMFTPEGYSYKQSGGDGISARFKVNTHAMSLYEAYESKLHFGIFIANQNHFSNASSFIENGELTAVNSAGSASGIKVEMTEREYTYFDCLISGFDSTNAQHSALGLVISGYVYSEDENGNLGEVSYLQKTYAPDNDDTTADTAYITSVSKDASLGVVTIVQMKAFDAYVSGKQN